MKLPENNIPKSIFFYLSMKDVRFSLSESDPVSVFLDNLCTVPFSYPVAEIVPEHSPENRDNYSDKKVSLAPESSDQYHDIHSWYGSPDDRK